jgi:Asp-tRNA(Asn)/Glu-tRNA(Gln) amidotransferase A subunit family amidase
MLHKKTTAVVLCITIVSAGWAGILRAQRTTPFHIEEATIGDIQSGILAKQITAVDVVNMYLARIKAYNGTCVEMPEGLLGPIKTIPHAGQLNALGTLNLRPSTRRAMGFDDHKARSMTDLKDDDPTMPDALEVAATQDREFARTGKLVGPLHGVVMSIKDWYDTVDMRTTASADVLFANDRPPRDADHIRRLREAGAIILAKANAGTPQPRNAFGGVVCNPYDTERTPGVSSAGSGTSVSANLVTCSIGEETGTSIRIPARSTNVVGLAPTQELVSRDGMIGAGINTRVGPICRTVEDSARILTVIAGYDSKDPLTVFSTGRMPAQPYETFAHGERLDGVRIGVVREFMNKRLFTKMDEENIDVVERAIGDLRELGATIVDPGPEGALFQACINKYAPAALNRLFTKQLPKQFPVDAQGKPGTDHIATLADMTLDPSLVPDVITIRSFGTAPAEGEGNFMREIYARERGDAAIKTGREMATKVNSIKDPEFYAVTRTNPGGGDGPQAMEMNMADRMLQRHAFQQTIMQCMAELRVDVVVYPTMNVPPLKIQQPEEPLLNNRGTYHWTVFGQQGFPTMTVPAGFTAQVYDRVADPASPDGTRLVGPTPAKLPVGIDFAGRPFDEPTLFKIASAYERATKHRMPPPEFGPVANQRSFGGGTKSTVANQQ